MSLFKALKDIIIDLKWPKHPALLSLLHLIEFMSYTLPKTVIADI